MRTYFIAPAVCLALLTGCASSSSAPKVAAKSVQLRGTAVEVQNFIEEGIRKNTSNFHVESATDRELVFKSHCMDTPNMNAFKCAAIMMGVGNSGWDGPYLYLTYRTAEVRGVVHLTASSKWCAINAFGKTNCMQGTNNSESNAMLDNIAAAYQKKVRPL